MAMKPPCSVITLVLLVAVLVLAATANALQASGDGGAGARYRIVTDMVNQTLTLLISLGVLVTGVIGIVNLVRTNGVHKLVNSQFSAAKAEIKEARDEIAALKRHIAAMPGSSTEEQVRADVATEQLRKPPPLPRDT